MGAELLPCPMCGCAATFVKHSAGVQGTQGFDKWDAVACKHCRTTVGACDRRFRCREDAAEAWNRRVPQSALESERQAHAAEVERLRGMLQLTFTEEQCIDLFAAALYISARGDETSVLSEENAERIAELLCDLSGIDLTAATREKESS